MDHPTGVDMGVSCGSEEVIQQCLTASLEANLCPTAPPKELQKNSVSRLNNWSFFFFFFFSFSQGLHFFYEVSALLG